MSEENNFKMKETGRDFTEVYKTAVEHIQADNEFEDKTIRIIEEGGQSEAKSSMFTAAKDIKKEKRPFYQRKIFYLAAAVCAIIIVLFIPMITSPGRFSKLGELTLEHSTGVKVDYVDKAPDIRASYSLVSLTEEQILGEYSSVIFRGTVKDIQNIVISLGGMKEYRAIATVTVGETYRGELAPGDEVQILLPCPIAAGIWVEDTEVASAIRVGMEGIFLPRKYDEGSIWSQDGATLYLMDLCAYGLSDGARFAFLKTDQGILYSDWAFAIDPKPSTLEEVKDYILSKISSGD